jgi:2-polyprenyl-6-methoxyphenol hydroxylase-like FAD-dependent oxidoreductase
VPDEKTDLVIVGGGPAGMMAGLLFARAGVRTLVLEKHGDFLRDFRGDTVHPSTLRLFSELGMLERLLERPHNKFRTFRALIGGRRIEIGDFFSAFDPRWNFLALMPQWEFLDFIADEARLYPTFSLRMRAEVRGLVWRDGRVAGIAVRENGAEREIGASLVIAADGRDSRLRDASQLQVRDLGAPMDVFWFSLPKRRTAENETTGVVTAGRILALLDRGDYWQCAYIFAKGQIEALRSRGLDAFREEVARIAPPIADAVHAVESWDDLKLLSVKLDRLEQWHRPGLLIIGDAAHAMSPIGGVGINVAIQDAVAAANFLAGPMAAGKDPDPLLPKVQARRLLPVRLTQAFQNAAQKRIIRRVLASQAESMRPPLPVRLLRRFALLRRIPAAFLGFGIRAEHIRSPDAGLRRAATPRSTARPLPSRD